MFVNNEKFSDEEFDLFRNFAMKKLGINFADTKKILVYSRLRNRVNELGYKSFTEYYDFLTHDRSGKELIYFTNKLTTNYTYFMRENNHFEYLIKYIYPEFEKKYGNNKKLRIWSAGCSTGEEPYVLAMYTDKYFANKKISFEIIASDISQNALETAKVGIYESDKISKVPDDFMLRYFNKLPDNKVAIKDCIKKHITFKTFNLNVDSFSSLGTFNVILCRNVMIYFNNPTKEKLIENFNKIIDSDGYLIVSRSESLNNIKSNFQIVTPSVYKKTIIKG